MDEIKERIYKKVLCDIETKCWVWQSTLNISGYGSMGRNGKTVRAHRLSYEAFKGEIPQGLIIDHVCKNRKCVNPDHLEPVTPIENGSRERAGNWNRDKTHCKRGHEFSESNTKITMRKYGHDGWVLRTCLQCRKIVSQMRKDGLSQKRAGIHERFLKKVKVDENGCWVWQAYLNNGYGRFKRDGYMRQAHRVSYSIFIGDFDESLTVDHICFNRACVNPAHLQLLTLEENSRRGGKNRYEF